MASIPSSVNDTRAKARLELREAVDSADIVPLTMALVHLTGDETLLDAIQPYVKGPWDYSHSVPESLARDLRDRMAQALDSHAEGDGRAFGMPSPGTLQRMMGVAVGEFVPGEYVPMMLEQMALQDTSAGKVQSQHRQPDEAAAFHVIIIGAGVSGLCAAIKLRAAGISFTVIEKNRTVGGTWFENRYPGCAVDTPNHFYSYSFEPNHDWTHYFSRRDQLWAYLERCADKFDVRRSTRFDTEVISARYNEAKSRWRVDVRKADGSVEHIEANAVIAAVGQLNRPKLPDIPKLASFTGPVMHTAQWDGSVDLVGRKVALLGTGASGMQVGPSIAPDVERLLIFQRSPNWVVRSPNIHRAVGEGKKWALKNIPFYAQWYRFQLFWGFGDGVFPALRVDREWHLPKQSVNATSERYRQAMIRHIQREIGDDSELLRKVIPDYPPYGKRVLADNHWYRMLKRDNVDLITDSIAHVERDAIVTEDGRKHRVDVIVMATGFQAGRMLWPMEIEGRDGRTIREVWGDDNPRAHLGITVPNFPNLFVLYGPNTNLGHGGSAIFLAECEVGYTVKCLEMLVANDWAAIECRQDVHDAYNQQVDDELRGLVWTHEGVGSWYKNRHGRVVTNQPWRMVDFWKLTTDVKVEDFIVTPSLRTAADKARKAS